MSSIAARMRADVVRRHARLDVTPIDRIWTRDAGRSFGRSRMTGTVRWHALGVAIGVAAGGLLAEGWRRASREVGLGFAAPRPAAGPSPIAAGPSPIAAVQPRGVA